MAFARMNGADAEPQFTVSWSARHYRTLITHDDDHKYCIVEARSRQTGTIQYHVVSMPLSYHSMIMDSYTDRMGREWELQTHGGGLLTIDRKTKKLRTYGRSGGYGPPDMDLLKEVLMATMPQDWELDITTTNYIRG